MALVLVVDDEAHVRAYLRDTITMSGHEVMEAASADAAVKVMATRPADVVFTDIQMPGNDGVWLTLELRKKYPRTAIVLATAVGDLPTTVTLRFGVLSYLLKPFTVKAINDALRLAVEWHDDAAVRGETAVEHDRLEDWLNSLEIF